MRYYFFFIDAMYFVYFGSLKKCFWHTKFADKIRRGESLNLSTTSKNIKHIIYA